MPRILFTFLFLLALAPPAPAAELNGAVTDSATGEALPYASIALPGLGRGTYSDLHGRFKLSALPNGAWPVEISAIGYRTLTDTVRLTADTSDTLAIALPPDPILLKPETDLPARSLEELLDGLAGKPHEKIFHARYPDLRTYRFSASGTQTLYAGPSAQTDILSRIEFDAESLYRNPDRLVQRILAYRSLGAIPGGFGMHPGVFINIRRGRLNGQEFDLSPLPLEPDARKHYRYRLLGNVRMGDIAVYHIRIAPRKKNRPALEGDIWISAADSTLVGYDLKFNRALLKKLRISELRTYQENARYYDRYWLPVQQSVRIRTAGGHLAEQITHISDYVLNPSLPDTLFAAPPLTVHPNAANRSDTYWADRGRRLNLARLKRLEQTRTLPRGWQRLLEAEAEDTIDVRMLER